ncbi:MAG: hypothetical protein NT023_18655 [Armatimonadetes bacterium]|nr:hypothetical protein [Armatimonadota bacterium]
MNQQEGTSICHTCEQQYDTRDEDIQYCTHCGWSLGCLVPSVTPNPIALIGHSPTLCTLQLEHRGAGKVSFTLLNLPVGVQASYGAGSGMPLSTRKPRYAWQFQVSAESVPKEAEALHFTIDTDTQQAHANTEEYLYRPADLAFQSQITVSVPLQRQNLGPILALNETLCFRSPHQPQFLYLKNEGDAPDELTLEVFEGDFGIECSGKEARKKETLTIQARQSLQVSILPPALIRGQETYQGGLRVSGKGIVKPQEILLLASYPKPLEKPTERWIIGIDFGTYKSAVYVIDNLNTPDTLTQVVWSSNGTERYKMPSVVMYPPSSGQPRFAWQVPTGVTSDSLVIRSMKRQLYEDITYTHGASGRKYSSLEVATDFLRFLLRQLRNNPIFQGEDPFENARVVMSLPVLDDDEKFKIQKEKTLLAAKQAGFPTGITTISEPEAAAIDFLYHYEQRGLRDLRDKDCICVFDSGAGTTDICILKVDLSQSIPSFRCLIRLGFPIGGDLVDALLAERFKAQLPQEKIAVSDSALIADIRTRKETLSFPDDESKLEEDEKVLLDESSFGEGATISWSLIASLYEPYVQMMLETGVPKDATYPVLAPEEGSPEKGIALHRTKFPDDAYPSLREKMKGFEEPIKWLCLTGGGTFIPCVVSRLLDMFNSSQYTPKFIHINAQQGELAPLYTMNVARGATLCPLVDLNDLFPYTIVLRFEAPSLHSPAPVFIHKGSSPHTNSNVRIVNLKAGDMGILTLFKANEERGEPERLVYSDTFSAPPHHSLRMSLGLQYRADARLHLVITYQNNGDADTPNDKDTVIM